MKITGMFEIAHSDNDIDYKVELEFSDNRNNSDDKTITVPFQDGNLKDPLLHDEFELTEKEEQETLDYIKNEMGKNKMTKLTVKELIKFLLDQPMDAKILLEDSNGSKSYYMEKDFVYGSWELEGENEDQNDNIVMFTSYKE